jgi:hypothetical protein
LSEGDVARPVKPFKPIWHGFRFCLRRKRRFARSVRGLLIMLVFTLILLWLAACLGVLSVWVLRDAPSTDASPGAAVQEPTTQ